MQIFFDDKNIRSARMDELPTVIEILSESFKDDPHMNWILEQSRYSEKINVLDPASHEVVLNHSNDRA